MKNPSLNLPGTDCRAMLIFLEELFPQKKTGFGLLCGLLASVLLGPSSGYGRPTETDDTSITQVGRWRTEQGVDYERTSDGWEWAIAPSFAYSPTKRLEAKVGWGYVFENPDEASAIETLKTAFEVKSKLWQAANGGLSWGLKGKISFPSSMRGPQGANDPEGYLKLLVTRPVGPAQYDFNFAYQYDGGWEAGDNDAYFVSTAFRFKVSTKWQLLAEIFAEIPSQRSGDTTGVVAAGCKYTIRDRLKADLLIGTGLGRDSARLRVACGCAWEL